MRAIDIKHAEVGTVTSRVDGAVSFRVITPELSLDERATILGLHGKNVRIMVEPIDVPVEGLTEVKAERDAKTPAQRLRAVIFVHWKEAKVSGDFEAFYRQQMERIIGGYKEKNLSE